MGKNEAKELFSWGKNNFSDHFEKGQKSQQRHDLQNKNCNTGGKKASQQKADWKFLLIFCLRSSVHSSERCPPWHIGKEILTKALVAQNNITYHLQRRQLPVWNTEAPHNTPNLTISKRKKKYASKRQLTGSLIIFFSFENKEKMGSSLLSH